MSPADTPLAGALRWIAALLVEAGIPYQLVGDIAVAAHGATRQPSRVELFVAAAHVPAVLAAATGHVTDYPWRRRDADWDRVALALAFGGVEIDVNVVEGARYHEAATDVWHDAAIDPGRSARATVCGLTVPVMPRVDLCEQLRRIDRATDRRARAELER